MNSSRTLHACAIAHLLTVPSALAQSGDFAIFTGEDSTLKIEICIEWDQATPLPIGCPPVITPTESVGGCASIEMSGDPIDAAVLHDFEFAFESTIVHDAIFFTQGSVSHYFSEPVYRMVPGSAPIVATPTIDPYKFQLADIPVEFEGLLIVTGRDGDAGDAFPADIMNLADFTFPPVSAELNVRPDILTGEVIPTLKFNLGNSFSLPGGRLDVGSGFIVGIGATSTITLSEQECDGPGCPADANNDGALTPADFTAWINAFNNDLPECDQNGDVACTPADFSAWIANYNAGC